METQKQTEKERLEIIEKKIKIQKKRVEVKKEKMNIDERIVKRNLSLD